MNQVRGILFAGILIGLLYACVEPYDPQINLTAEVLIIDGNLTDSSETQVVKIAHSRAFSSGYTTTLPVKGASVQLVLNGNQNVAFRETTTGVYSSPEGFRVQPGIQYQLKVALADGNQYASGLESLPTKVKINKVSDAFNAKAIANTEKTEFTAASLIYVDLNDPAGEPNYYRWQWTLWEQQTWCATCLGGRYIVSNPATGDGACQRVTVLPPNGPLDYNCIGACWEIIRGTNYLIFTDTYSNGLPVTNHLAAMIPYYQEKPALLEMRQFAISRGAYLYYRILQNQTASTGGLANTPPSPPIGNITNVANENEPVVGYFSVSSVSAKRYWLDRKNVAGAAEALGLFQALNNRLPAPEDPVLLTILRQQPPYEPLARCVASDTRTPIKPAGWQD